jgi:AraC-like DNA-binding protein
VSKAARSRSDRPTAPGGAAPRARAVASGEGWSVSEFFCDAGPSDPPFEESHEGFSIAAVVEGAFTYHSERGATFLHAGAVLLGNHGRCFACRHDHGLGDRCVAFNFEPELFAEIAASAAGSGRYRFGADAAPAGGAMTPVVAGAEVIARERSPLSLEEGALRLAEWAIASLSGRVAAPTRASGRETRRIADALRVIEERAAEPLDLASLAGVARMSKYHFLRVFRRVVGTTPHQALLNARMRRAAVRLFASRATIASIAFEAGFGDLSTFNHRFRAAFGLSPSAYRARGPL